MDTYESRAERAQFIHQNFAFFLQGHILDVGCGEGYFRSLIGPERYVGLDIVGRADVVVNLDHGSLPFPDATFDCVVCTDVLEHLEHIHAMLDELLRVSRRYIIISLPNPAAVIWPRILRGMDSGKFYGLPTERPRDRHRWFFTYAEARAFIRERSLRHQAHLIHLRPIVRTEHDSLPTKLLASLLKVLLRQGDHYHNLYATALWAVLEKSQQSLQAGTVRLSDTGLENTELLNS
jgi:2-polyprenyl-3-methyl-5-hydroxy-6-metoxy-1,4-benzoquinol methylase